MGFCVILFFMLKFGLNFELLRVNFLLDFKLFLQILASKSVNFRRNFGKFYEFFSEIHAKLLN